MSLPENMVLLHIGRKASTLGDIYFNAVRRSDADVYCQNKGARRRCLEKVGARDHLRVPTTTVT